MFRHIITSLCLGLVLGSTALAQDVGTLEGTVTGGAGVPLSGAVVRIAGQDRLGAITDARGAFRIAGIPFGTQHVIIEGYGWDTGDLTVTISSATPRLRATLNESPVNVAGVVVTAAGAPQRQMESSVSVGAVTARELREAKPSHPAHIAGRIPGVYVSVAGSGEGHMTAIRQPLTTNPVYLYLEDGVPTRSTGFFNHNAMYEVNVPQAGRIEILKGPGTALYGSDAIGGVINVQTQAPSEQTTFSAYAEGGSHTWNRELLSFSGTRGANGIRGDFNYTRWGGWRNAADYDRQSATLRWDRTVNDKLKLKTVLAYARIDQMDASALGRAEYETTPDLNYYLFTSRNIRSLRASTSLDLTLGESHINITPYLRDADMDLVPFFMLTFDPVTYNTGHRSAGLLLRGRTNVKPLRAQVTGGVDVDYSPGYRTENQITMTRAGSTYSSYQVGTLLYDYDVTFAGVSPYAQIDFTPVDRLHLNVGARYDAVGYDYDNHLDSTSVGRWRRPADTSIRYQQLSPKLGVAWEIAPWLGMFASYRESFRAPSESQIFRQGSSVNTTSLQPIVVQSREVGARGVIAERLDYEVSLYDMSLHDDVLTFVRPDGVREVQNAGETRHRGVELGLGIQIATWLRFDAAQSWSKQTYERWQPRPTLSYGGNEVERAPRGITNLRLRVKPANSEAVATLEWSRISRYWEEPENTHMYEGHALLNVNTNVPLKWGVSLNARVLNITDKRYAEHAAFNAADSEQLQPGAPRMIYLGLQKSFSL